MTVSDDELARDDPNLCESDAISQDRDKSAAEAVFFAWQSDDDASDFSISASAYRSLIKHITAAIARAREEGRRAGIVIVVREVPRAPFVVLEEL